MNTSKQKINEIVQEERESLRKIKSNIDLHLWLIPRFNITNQEDIHSYYEALDNIGIDFEVRRSLCRYDHNEVMRNVNRKQQIVKKMLLRMKKS